MANVDSLDATDQAVFERLKRTYPGVALLKFFNAGSTARVYLVELPLGPPSGPTVKRIIKVLRHDSELGADIDLERLFSQEVRTLAETSHTNIVSIYSVGQLDLPSAAEDHTTTTVPYYVMEYLPGAQDLDIWLAEHNQITRAIVLSLLLQACQGLNAIHASGRLHCDVKTGNLLVGSDGTLKIADLGFSKVIKRGTDKTCVYTTFTPLPEAYRQYVEKIPDKRAAHVSIPRDLLGPEFDIHYMGQVVRQVIAIPPVTAAFSTADLSYLRLIAERTNIDARPSIPKYKSCVALVEDLRKLDPLYLRRAGVEELSDYTGTRSVRIPVSGNIMLSDRLKEVLGHPLMLRLHKVLQLGLTYYVFPGATHTRFEHSLGVYYQLGAYINALLADDNQPYFRQLVDEEKIITALLAGLLHDLGQHSFAHSFEDFGVLGEHEGFSVHFIEGTELNKHLPEPYTDQGGVAATVKRYWPEANVPRLCWMISGKRAPGLDYGDLGWQMVRALLSGPIDADKTDYLPRDAHHAGVEYAGSIDLKRLVNSLTGCVVTEGTRHRGVVGITWKGLQSAENVILARMQMFWVLYWHHAVRAAHAMVGHACIAHLGRSPEAALRDEFTRILFGGSIGEVLAVLQKSHAKRARDLSRRLALRQLYKRGIELDYARNRQLYSSLMKAREASENGGDVTMASFCKGLAEAANTELARLNRPHRFTFEDILVDVPIAEKDRLDPLYVMEKGSERPVPHAGRALIGSQEDWQHRIRKARVFVAPNTPNDVRAVLAERGEAILEDALASCGL